MQTDPIDNDPDFRALEAHADAGLRPKGYKLQRRKGSSSWTDSRIKPADAAVRFKLCFFRNGIFFGAREDWATSLAIPAASVGATSVRPRPTLVQFRGDYIKNDAPGRRRIDAIIALFP